MNVNALARLRVIAASILGGALSGCGGSGVSGLPSANPAQAPLTPTNSNTRSASAVIKISPQGGTYTMPSVGGFATQIGFAAASSSGGTTLEVTTSLDAPAGATSLQSKLRLESTSTTDVLYYLIFTPSLGISFPSLPTVSMTLPSTTPTSGRDFFASISIPPETGAELSFLDDGPASVSGQTVTFAADPHPLTLAAGKQYIFAFYDTRANVATGPSIRVADSVNNAVYTFPLSANGNVAPTSVLKGPLTGLNAPSGVAEDSSGRLYMLDGGAPPGAPGVTMYAAGAKGNVSPFAVIHQSGPPFGNSNIPITLLIDPVAIAVNPSGAELYTETQHPFEFPSGRGVIMWARSQRRVLAGQFRGLSKPEYLFGTCARFRGQHLSGTSSVSRRRPRRRPGNSFEKRNHRWNAHDADVTRSDRRFTGGHRGLCDRRQIALSVFRRMRSEM